MFTVTKGRIAPKTSGETSQVAPSLQAHKLSSLSHSHNPNRAGTNGPSRLGGPQEICWADLWRAWPTPQAVSAWSRGVLASRDLSRLCKTFSAKLEALVHELGFWKAEAVALNCQGRAGICSSQEPPGAVLSWWPFTQAQGRTGKSWLNVIILGAGGKGECNKPELPSYGGLW